jgi:hypothetical protein
VPEDGVLDAGVMVAARSRGTNRPLTLGWLFHMLLDARMCFTTVGDDGVDKTARTRLLHELISDKIAVRCWTSDVAVLDGVTLTWDDGRKAVIRGRF